MQRPSPRRSWSPLICLVHTGRAIPLSPELSLTQALLSISYSRCKFFQGTILSQAASFKLLALSATILHSAEGWLWREMLVRRVLKVPVWQRQLCVSCFLLWLPGSQSGGAGGSLPDDQWRSHFRMSGKVRESRLGGVGEDHPLEPAARLPLLPWWFSLLCLALLRPSAALLPLGWQRVDQQRFCSVRLVFAPLSDFSRVPRGWDSTKSAA